MHPMLAVMGTLLVLGVGFSIIYGVARHFDKKKKH
jgi:hypothetical protein